MNGDRDLRPRSAGDELGGVVAGADALEAGVDGGLDAETGLDTETGLAAETGLRVGDTLLRGLAAGRRLRATVPGAGEDVDAEAGVPTARADAGAEAGGARTLPALLLSASLSPAVRGAFRRTRRAGVSVAPVVVRGNVDFRAVCLVRRGPLAFCPSAPTPRAISAMPLSSVNLDALPSSSSSSSLSAKSPGGGRARLTRPAEPTLALGPGSRARML